MDKFSERAAVVGVIDPDTYAANTYSTAVIDMSLWRSVLFVIQIGTMAANSTVDFLVNGDTASGGAFATAVTGKAITQLLAATDSDKQALVEVTAEEVAAQGLRYIRGDLVIAVAASDSGVVALGTNRRYQPASGYDLASVAEIVS